MTLALSFFAALCYALATAHTLSRLFHPDGPDYRKTYWIAGVALTAHLVLLIQGVFTQHGQDLSFSNVALLISWLITLSVTMLSLRLAAPLLLPVSYGFVALLVIAALFIPHHVIVASMDINLGLVTHVALSFIAYCVLIIASLFAIQSYFISKRLKARDLTIANSHLPPLLQVERQLYSLLTSGTLLLTLALASGFAFLDGMFAKPYIHKTVLSLMAWLMFAIVVVGHRVRGWRGNSATVSVVIAASLLTLSYFGAKFVQEILLGRV